MINFTMPSNNNSVHRRIMWEYVKMHELTEVVDIMIADPPH